MALGLRVPDAAAVDRRLGDFLGAGSSAFDQAPVGAYRALADLFDRIWLPGVP